MPRFQHYQCPECDGTFRWLHHPKDEPPPNFCPLCGSCMNADPVFMPAAPHIGKSIGKSADAVYRQMEQAGANHAQMAAELAGGEASDYSGLNVTDLPDYLRPGDTAANIASDDNAVKAAMASGQGGFKPMLGMSGADFAAGTVNGAFPRRGEATRQSLVASHQDRVRAIEGQGRVSRNK